MKKSLLALAVLGAFASAAQAQVTIGGVIQANVKDYKVTSPAAGRTPANEIRVDDDYTSRFWLTGTEDLGGGNSALFYIENRFNTDVQNNNGVGNGLGNGDTFVGLKGGWGQLTVGKHTMMYTQGLATELGKNGISAIPSSMWGTFSILDEINGAYVTVSRVGNSILYKTPNLSGFSGSLGYSTAPTGTEGNLACTNGGQQNYVTNAGTAATGCPTATPANNNTYSQGGAGFITANYSNGPIYVNLAGWKEYAEGQIAGSDKTQYRLSGSYAFPFGLKVGLQYDKAKSKTAATGIENGNRAAWELPVSYTFGANTILGSYTKAGDNTVAGTKVASSGAKMFTLGYDYALSKRTNVGVFYSKLKNDTNGIYQPFLAGTSATGSGLSFGETATQFALGVKHTF
ncbi:MAG: porin [Burkholderiaceae bacterium]